ncbi:MAG: type II toxin-antitoxin system VapB family antitoxin [bacterium]|nr:type II toxin-antitoxin system VapB family antitoxin [bacterium]MDE0439446.1 type II toxin-antitoxin system VapB family antitoxin [bacterium]
MTKRLIDIDDGLLAEASEILGTTTMKETVNEALSEVRRAELRRQLVVQLSTMEGLDLDNDEVMASAWR